MQTDETGQKGFCEAEIEIKNADGLHMRPAMQFVDTASQYQASIAVSNNQTSADGKSIMQMSMLAATYGTRLKIKAEGVDANKAVEALRELVEVKKFGEPTPEEKGRPSTMAIEDEPSTTTPGKDIPGQALESGPPTTTPGKDIPGQAFEGKKEQ